MKLQQEAGKVWKNVFPGIMLEACDVVTSVLACRWVTQLDAVRVLFGVKPRFYLLFRRWMMEQFPGEKIVSLVRDTGSSFTEEAPKMAVEMHLVLCIYFTWSVTVSGG